MNKITRKWNAVVLLTHKSIDITNEILEDSRDFLILVLLISSTVELLLYIFGQH